MTASPFKSVTPDHPESGIVLEAVFDLPNDGTPTRNQLVVRISLKTLRPNTRKSPYSAARIATWCYLQECAALIP